MVQRAEMRARRAEQVLRGMTVVQAGEHERGRGQVSQEEWDRALQLARETRANVVQITEIARVTELVAQSIRIARRE